MIRSLKYTLSCLIVFLTAKINSQDHGFFNQTWLEQGLSQSSIVSMIQDRQGFMWFATQDGLNRYDGRNIDHFNFRPFNGQSVSGDFIYSVSLINNMLFVLSDKGMDQIDLVTLQISNLKNRSGNKNIFFKSWALGNSLFLYDKNGLAETRIISNSEFDFEYHSFKDSSGQEYKTLVYSLCADGEENRYAATSQGIFMQKKGEKVFYKIFDLKSAQEFKYDNERHYTTVSLKGNNLYFTNSNSLFRLNTTTFKTSMLSLKPFNSISSMLIDNQNNIWIGTTGKGLLVVSEKNDTLTLDKHFKKNSNSRFTLQSNEITYLYQNPDSKDDIVWIGTRDAGAFNYSYSKNSFSVPTSFISSADLNFFGVTKDKDGIIWAGFNTGILKINRNKKTHHIIDLGDILNKTNRPVEAICCDAGNNVWVSFGNSLYLIDKKSNSLVTKSASLSSEQPNHISRIMPLDSNQLALCTSKGLIIYNTQKNTNRKLNSITIDNSKVKIENVIAFLVDSENNWWIGGVNGIYCLRNDGNNFILKHNNADSNSILSNRIMDIKETEQGQILVATTKGLSIINRKGDKIKNIYQAKGLPNNFIYGLLKDNKGRFWMSTNFGLSVFNPKNFQFKSYTASDGICINEFNSEGHFKSDDGELIFGGLGGLVSIYPDRQIINRYVSDIVLRRMKIEGYPGPVDPDKTLSLDHWQNDMIFEFSVPDYSGEKNVNIFYRFKNKDTNWIKVNSSQLLSLSFINLAPGKYNLEVIAVNKEGASSKPFGLMFVISDPFWSTWWFYLILVLITVFLSWVIYRARLKRKISYIRKIEQIRKDESEKVRKAAALDLHDEFGNGLTRISMLIEMIRIHMAKENKDAHKLLDLISQNSNRLYQGTKDFIWSINPGKDNFYEIGIRIKDYADELFYGSAVTFEMEGLKEELKKLRQAPTAGRNITMIFKEALSNVLKHAKASRVRFTVKREAEKIYLTLEDNGAGFEMKDYKNSFGITNIQQRAGRLNADVNIFSEPEKGTKITLIINLNSKENDKHNP